MMAQRTSLADSDGQPCCAYMWCCALVLRVVLRALCHSTRMLRLGLTLRRAVGPRVAAATVAAGAGLLAAVSGASSLAHVAHNQRAARALAQRSPAAETTASQSPTDLLNTLATHLAPSTYAFPPL
eukprot:COSAG02_NODE_3939_length_6012_cov_129.782006_4_plen_126_part_00